MASNNNRANAVSGALLPVHLARNRSALRSGVCSAALALFAMAMTVSPAFAEPSVQQVLETLGPVAGADGLVTEGELRGWIADMVANDPDPNSTPPTPEQIEQLIAFIPSTTDGSGTRIFSLEDIVLMTAHQQLAENGGVWDGNSEPTLTQAAVIAQQVAGADGVLSEAEFRAWANSLTGSFQVSDADIDELVGRINAAGGTFSLLSLLGELSSGGGDDGSGDNGGGGGGDSGSGELTIDTIRHQLSVIAGDDHTLTAEEFRAWVATLPADQQPPADELDRFIASIAGSSDGDFTVDAVMVQIAATETDGSGGTGGGDGEVVENNDGGQQPGWNCTFGANREDCRHSLTGQVSVSATGPGGPISATNSADIMVTEDRQPGIVLQIRPYFDPATGNSTPVYDHPDMALVNTGAITTTGSGSPAINALGGSGAIRVENSGNLSATGDNARGIFVSTGMYNLGVPGGDIVIVNSGDIVASVVGIEAQSGRRGDGGDITITNTGNIGTTYGTAIQASGDGGNIAITNSGTLTVGGNRSAISAHIDGGSAAVTNSGAITLNGAGADAISVEADVAVPGGGAQFAYIANSGNISLLGEDQTGLEAFANHGQVNVSNSGEITSSRRRATGISVDGIDAVVQNSGTVALTGESSMGIVASTASGTVDVQNSGTVRATGADNLGIFTVGVFGGSTVVVNSGTIVGGSGSTTFESRSATGEGDGTEFTGSAGVMMLGSASNELVNSGSISALNGLAVATFGGPLTIYEWDSREQTEVPVVLDIPVADTTIRNQAAGLIDGDIRLGSGDDRIYNSGRITGEIDMAGGANLLENALGGVLTGNSLIVGAGNTLTNSGTISPGGTGVISETIIVGNFVQTATGSMVIDINEGAGVRNDTINVSGTASLAGTVTPNVIDLAEVVQSEYRILASQGLTDNGIVANPAEVQVTDTVGYDFALEQRDNDLYLLAERQRTASEIAAEAAAAAGASGEQQQNYEALGGTLEQLENSGDDSANPVLNAVRLQDGPASAARVMDRLIPQQQGGQAGGASRSGASFGNAMLSCATRDGEYAYTREGKCYYAKLTVRRLEHDASAAGAGVKETGTEAMGGVQFDIGGERRLGLAFGYEDINSKAFSTVQSLGSSEGQRFQGGVVLKDQWGPINAYLNITGNYTDLDSKRFVNLGGFTNALAEHEVISGLVKLRLSYLRDMGAWYVKPLVDVGASYIHLGGYTETGAGAFNLTVASSDKWLFSVMPGLEIGGEMRDGGGTIWRPYIRAGVTVFNDDGLSVTAGFADAPAGVAGFNVATQLDTVYADIDAGMHLLTTSGVNLRFNYEGRYGESTRQHAGTVKLSVPY